MKCLLKIILRIITLISVYEINCYPLTNSGEILDYYWREYTGIIPGDAIPGGIDASGNALYIGQMYLLGKGLLPATIRPGSSNATASHGGLTYTSDRFVKILCSQNLNKYKWILTKNEETHLLTTCHLVIGGTEAGFVLNIGRVHHELETTIGKVFAHHTPYRGLGIPYSQGTKKEATYQSYEILTYDCNLNNSSYLDNSIPIANITAN